MKRKRAAAAVLTALMVVLLLSPAVPAKAAHEAERWELDLIRAEFSARAGITGQGVRIAVIDSGISALAGISGLEPGRDYTGEGGTEDTIGHGTFIAGILSGGESGGEFRGVAPEARLIPLRCFSPLGGEVSDAVSAIYDAVEEFGCRVICLSFGQLQDTEELREAVEYALDRGAVVVAAAGNSGSDELYYPAAYDGVIAVNAVDSRALIAADAQHNASVALSAPGVKVLGLLPEGGYKLRSGSSFAVPFVAGAAALLLSVDGSLTPEQVRDVLCRTAADRGEPGWDEYYGWGILDLEAALTEVLKERGCWLFPVEAVPGGIAVTVLNPGEEALEACCRLGGQELPLRLEPGQTAVLRFPHQSEAAVCGVWTADGSGGEVCISNVREWAGGRPVFSDVPEDAWYSAGVTEAAAAGYMLGLPDGSFAPGGEVTRGMFVTVLYRYSGSPEAAEGSPFADVAPEDWFAPAVCWAWRQGLVSGVGEDRFAPEIPLTREAMAVILLRMGAGKDRDPCEKRVWDYADAETISPWALEGMEYCVSAGLLQGVSETELSPRGTLTRAALAVLLVRLDFPAAQTREIDGSANS